MRLGKREALTGLVTIFLLHLIFLLRICLPHLMESAIIDQSPTKEMIGGGDGGVSERKNKQKAQKRVFVAVVLLYNSHYVMPVGAN